MNKKILFTGCFSMAIGAVLLLFWGARGDRSVQDEKPLVSSFSVIPEVPLEISFCGEKIDLSRLDMYERFDRELTSFTYTHSSTLLLFKRANRYFPLIEPILIANNIPVDFKYLCAIESMLDPRAVSPAKAAGLWQLMPTTGRQYGLEVNSSIDERYHIEKSTEAACKYFRDAYEKFGSWTTVAASYNAGMARISNELSAQNEDKAFDLWLVEETSRYVFRMMALKQIMSHPYKYGFVIKSNQLYKPVETFDVEVDTTINDLASFAGKNGITYAQLKEFNCWMRDRSLPNKSGKRYTIKIPKKEDMHYPPQKRQVYQANWVVD